MTLLENEHGFDNGSFKLIGKMFLIVLSVF